MWRQRDRGVIPVVTNRDLRRTWKTLAGKAGVSKEIRDRLQNHTLQDVSSKSYDRWNYMPEKRAGMKKWDAWVTKLLARSRKKARMVHRQSRPGARLTADLERQAEDGPPAASSPPCDSPFVRRRVLRAFESAVMKGAPSIGSVSKTQRAVHDPFPAFRKACLSLMPLWKAGSHFAFHSGRPQGRAQRWPRSLASPTTSR
jgi:hypothetical protein